MEKSFRRSINIALWLIAANLTFLSLHLLTAPAEAQIGEMSEAALIKLAKTVDCDNIDDDTCWIRAVTRKWD